MLALGPHEIDFDRGRPDGWDGPAMPHGAAFRTEFAVARQPPTDPALAVHALFLKKAVTWEKYSAKVLRNNDFSADNEPPP